MTSATFLLFCFNLSRSTKKNPKQPKDLVFNFYFRHFLTLKTQCGCNILLSISPLHTVAFKCSTIYTQRYKKDLTAQSWLVKNKLSHPPFMREIPTLMGGGQVLFS